MRKIYFISNYFMRNHHAFWTGSFQCLAKSLLQKPSSESKQRAKKVVSDSPGLVDFAIGLVNSVFNLPDGQVMFFEEFE